MFEDNPIYKRSVDIIVKELPVKTGKVLITGASGLIGSCLVDVFCEANRNEGYCFDIFAMGRNGERLNNLFGKKNGVHCIVQDVINPIDIIGLDYVIHAASNADPRLYALSPVETIITNVLGAKSVLDYCKENRKTRALLTSTFEVYGKANNDYYSEESYGLTDINRIRSCYPESKRTAEMLFRAYHDEYGIDCVIVRLASIYGPTMLENDSKAHAQFFRNALDGKSIVLKSKGIQKRTYCYVMDAVSGLLKVLFEGASGEAYNVANDQSIATIYEVAKTIADYAGMDVSFTLPDELERKGNPIVQNCILKTEKLKALGWEGKYSLAQGVGDTLRILKDFRHSCGSQSTKTNVSKDCVSNIKRRDCFSSEKEC